MSSRRAGFTLIELLVVIAIIGLLSSIIMASLNTARMNARDARRIEDLRQVRLALELYYDANGSYPVVSTGWVMSCNSGWASLQTALSPYMSQLPVDPVNAPCNGPWTAAGANYSYAYGYNNAAYPGKYDLVAQFENTSHSQRCGVRGWRYHSGGGENVWCQGTHGISTPYSYNQNLYADH